MSLILTHFRKKNDGKDTAYHQEINIAIGMKLISIILTNTISLWPYLLLIGSIIEYHTLSIF